MKTIARERGQSYAEVKGYKPEDPKRDTFKVVSLNTGNIGPLQTLL